MCTHGSRTHTHMRTLWVLLIELDIHSWFNKCAALRSSTNNNMRLFFVFLAQCLSYQELTVCKFMHAGVV